MARRDLANTLLRLMPPPGEPQTIKELAGKTSEFNRHSIGQGLDVLRRRRLVERPETGRYILTKAGERFRDDVTARVTSGPNAPHSGRRRPAKGTVRARVWTALRQISKATIPELITLIDDPKANESNIQRYLKALVRANYVSILPRKDPGIALTSNGFNRYFLVENTGPIAPVANVRRKVLIDHNTGKEINIGGKSDAA